MYSNTINEIIERLKYPSRVRAPLCVVWVDDIVLDFFLLIKKQTLIVLPARYVRVQSRRVVIDVL